MSAQIAIELITVDPALQSREGTDEAVAADYASGMDAIREAIKIGRTPAREFPPVTVFDDGATKWLADGFHRIAAARSLGLLVIAADVRDGGRDDAVIFSAGANAAHGNRRTNAGKRRSVEMLLELSIVAEWPDRKIAEVAGVSVSFVAAVRRPDAAERQRQNMDAFAARRGAEILADEYPTDSLGRSLTTTEQNSRVLSERHPQATESNGESRLTSELTSENETQNASGGEESPAEIGSETVGERRVVGRDGKSYPARPAAPRDAQPAPRRQSVDAAELEKLRAENAQLREERELDRYAVENAKDYVDAFIDRSPSIDGPFDPDKAEESLALVQKNLVPEHVVKNFGIVLERLAMARMERDGLKRENAALKGTIKTLQRRLARLEK